MKTRLMKSYASLLFLIILASNQVYSQVTVTTTSYKNTFSGTTVNATGQSWLANVWSGGVITYAQNNQLTATLNPYMSWNELDNILTSTIDITANPVLTFAIKGSALPAPTYMYAQLVDASGNITNTAASVLFPVYNSQTQVLSFNFTTLKASTNFAQIKKIKFVLTDATGTTSPNSVTGSIIFSGLSLGSTTITASTPQVNLAGALSGFIGYAGTPSATQIIDLSAVSSTITVNNLTLTAPTGYEISFSPTSGFAATLTTALSSGGYLANKLVYARLNSATTGTFNGNLTVTDGTYSSTIALTGTVNAAGTAITASPATLANFTSTLQLPSASVAVRFTGSSLASPIHVAAPTDFQVTTDPAGSWFAAYVDLYPVSGTLNQQFWVRYNPQTVGNHSEFLTVTGTAVNQQYALTGTATDGPTWKAYGTQMFNLNTGHVAIGLNKGDEPTLTTDYYKHTINGRTNIIGGTNALELWSPTTQTTGYRHYMTFGIDQASSVEYGVIGVNEYNSSTGLSNYKHLVMQSGGGGIIIGSTSLAELSTYKVVVNGKIKAKGLNVIPSGWADFVFDEDYKLLPLAEVEAYVKSNKHLPAVPAASQVEENGVDVAEMNKILLQKVEELTLYVIQLNKEVELLKKSKK